LNLSRFQTVCVLCGIGLRRDDRQCRDDQGEGVIQ
jgi:hypothetical protein